MKKKKPSLAETVSRNIRKARLEAGMTQKELADKAGFKVSYIARLETKPQNITLHVLDQISASLRTSPQKLISDFRGSKSISTSYKNFSNALALLNSIDSSLFNQSEEPHV